LHLARSAQNEGDFSRAIEYFQKALELAPYLHEAHFGVAMAYYELGALDSADHALRLAIDSTTRNSARKLYKGKLAALRREI
ncbi:MAG: tetratricopeptide repeat protein, partial [Gammaproteobacteria bacterium]|nr:tetratricopeptide repeat protein [Gammaproteobacteria bacterium]